MSGERLPRAILRAASLVLPAEARAAWVEEWRTELWYIPRKREMRFCLGAFRDAWWVRRNSEQSREWLASPVACLALLTAVAAASVFLALLLPGPDPPAHLSLRDVPDFCIWMMMLSCLLLPATRLAIGPWQNTRDTIPWRNRVRRAVFLGLKIALIQPTMVCGFLVLLQIEPVAPLAPLVMCAQWILTFRWVLLDQRRRCPVCLRLLTDPVRIGSASATFLKWYGAGSMCSLGHGLLQVPEVSSSSWAARQWLSLEGVEQR